MMRHYAEMHGYDKQRSAIVEPDPESPDGELCPECGEHFVTKHNMIKHILKLHTKSTGALRGGGAGASSLLVEGTVGGVQDSNCLLGVEFTISFCR